VPQGPESKRKLVETRAATLKFPKIQGFQACFPGFQTLFKVFQE